MAAMTVWVTIDCPCCANRVSVGVIPGEAPVHYPNDRAHPGSPPEIDVIEGCECWDYLSDTALEDGYYRKVMDRVDRLDQVDRR